MAAAKIEKKRPAHRPRLFAKGDKIRVGVDLSSAQNNAFDEAMKSSEEVPSPSIVLRRLIRRYCEDAKIKWPELG
jgi:hypothetical protein